MELVFIALVSAITNMGCAATGMTSLLDGELPRRANDVSIVTVAHDGQCLPPATIRPPVAGGCEKRSAVIKDAARQSAPSLNTSRAAAATRKTGVIQVAAWTDQQINVPYPIDASAAGCEPGAVRPTDQTPPAQADLMAFNERLAMLEAELTTSRQELADMRTELAAAQEQAAALTAQVAHWQSEVDRLEQTMLTQHEADIETLTQLADTMTLLADSVDNSQELRP